MRKFSACPKTESLAAIRAVEQYLSSAQSETVSKMHLLGTGAVAELEQKLRAHYGMRHALCVTNATSGLLAVALALDLREAEFMAPPLGFGGTIAAWLLLGNRPRFADIDPADLGIDPDAAAQLITPATKALLAPDVLGIPADSRRLRRLADDFGLFYVADAAQSLGAWRDGLPGGALADAVVVSFTVGKTVFAGEGGAVLTNNSVLYEKLLWVCQHPERQRRELGLGLWNEFGLNLRPHPLGAVWANAVFEQCMEDLGERRQWCYKVLDLLNASGDVEPVDFRARNIEPSFAHLTASWRTVPRPSEVRDLLAANGISARIEPAPVRIHYRQPAFQAQFELAEVPRCPVAEYQESVRFCIVRDDVPRGD
jgi:dTDP-4-amino-4,6-dideoxygalactose transaminase